LGLLTLLYHPHPIARLSAATPIAVKMQTAHVIVV